MARTLEGPLFLPDKFIWGFPGKGSHRDLKQHAAVRVPCFAKGSSVAHLGVVTHNTAADFFDAVELPNAEIVCH